jgi:hypothetical protein
MILVGYNSPSDGITVKSFMPGVGSPERKACLSSQATTRRYLLRQGNGRKSTVATTMSVIRQATHHPENSMTIMTRPLSWGILLQTIKLMLREAPQHEL